MSSPDLGFKPGTSRLWDERANHYTTEPLMYFTLLTISVLSIWWLVLALCVFQYVVLKLYFLMWPNCCRTPQRRTLGILRRTGNLILKMRRSDKWRGEMQCLPLAATRMGEAPPPPHFIPLPPPAEFPASCDLSEAMSSTVLPRWVVLQVNRCSDRTW